MSHSICRGAGGGPGNNDLTQAAQLLKKAQEAVRHRVCIASIGRWWRTQWRWDEAFALAGGFLAPRHISQEGTNLQVAFLLHLPLRRCFWWRRLESATSKDRALNGWPRAMPRSGVGSLFGKSTPGSKQHGAPAVNPNCLPYVWQKLVGCLPSLLELLLNPNAGEEA